MKNQSFLVTYCWLTYTN